VLVRRSLGVEIAAGGVLGGDALEQINQRALRKYSDIYSGIAARA
jgi:hypothetical protein